jgi:hypothetical protein
MTSLGMRTLRKSDEERLHQMVCHGDVNLATAQQDISKELDRGLPQIFTRTNLWRIGPPFAGSEPIVPVLRRRKFYKLQTRY